MQNTFPLDTILTLSEKGVEVQKKYTLPLNSLNVSCIGTLGLVTINKMALSTNQNINSIIPNNQNTLYYLYFFCKENIKQILEGLGGGSVFGTVSKTKFENIKLIEPDTETIKNFHAQVSVLMDRIYSNTLEIKQLTNLRDILLPKLISGQLAV